MFRVVRVIGGVGEGKKCTNRFVNYKGRRKD